jgi:hypothetical protein
MAEDTVIEVEGEIPETIPQTISKRAGKLISDLSPEEKEVIANDIRNGLEYEDVDCTFYKNGKYRVVKKKKGLVRTIPGSGAAGVFGSVETTEKPERTVKLTDTLFFVNKLLEMQETMITEEGKRKKLKNRFNEMYNTVNDIEDEEIATFNQEEVKEEVKEDVKIEPLKISPQQPSRKLTLREVMLAKNK